MLLQPITENAIKHGVEPNPDDSKIRVMARLENDRLLLTVADTGLGIVQSASKAGGGFGLDNIRQRLRALYASQARLTVSENVPRGFIAVIDTPLQMNVEKSEIVARDNFKGNEI